MKKGDRVRIIAGPPDKIGKMGEVILLMENGAMVKLSGGVFTPIKFKHLEVVRK